MIPSFQPSRLLILAAFVVAIQSTPPSKSLADSSPAIRADELSGETGCRPVEIDDDITGCGELLLHASTYRDGYSWQYGGVVAPDYGAFAECYDGVVEVCSAVFMFTQVGGQNGQTMDVYIWDDEGGEPGATLCVIPSVDPGPIGVFPDVTAHAIPVSDCCTTEEWWVGYWPNWPDQGAGWFLSEDLCGFGTGCPLTKIAPGIGYPTGWQNVSIIWGPTQDMLIGAEVRPCSPVPVEETTWGRLKSLF